jgi:hypothetical protein
VAERSIVNRLAVASSPALEPILSPPGPVKGVRFLAIVENPYEPSEQFTVSC